MKHFSLAVLALAGALAITPAAMADTWSFNVSGTGISGSGTLTFSPTATPGVDEITGITGTFTDSSAGITGAAITGLVPGSYNASSPSQVSAATGYNWSFDNLLYPAGTAPAINGSPAGGQLDNWGVLFEVAGGYEVNIWGNGAGQSYTVADSTGSPSNPFLDMGSNANFAATPEPSSLLLLGTGLFGLAFVMFRKATPSGLILRS